VIARYGAIQTGLDTALKFFVTHILLVFS
jgi:hypothetical protein